VDTVITVSSEVPDHSLELRSLVTDQGTLELSLADVTPPTVAAGQVLVRMEAAPINPSDLGLLFAGADMGSASVGGTPERPVVTVRLSDGAIRALAARVGQSLPAGNEGAGTVVAAGSSSEAQRLLARTVAIAGGAMYSQYRAAEASACLVLPEGTPARTGASSFVNPLTALGMIETMRMEDHSALVHTAAASNLGQMLVKLCLEENVPLVNIVRRPEQAELLRSIVAEHVCDSSASTFSNDLTEAITQTSATVAFDATGGGTLVSQILRAMEVAATASAAQYSRYGSTVRKQAYIYGGLDPGPTVLTRNFGFAWSLEGWLLTPFLQSIGPVRLGQLRDRVVADLTTTFASAYSGEISLKDMLDPSVFSRYGKHSTGDKFLVNPQLSD
jgi:NADPH2:quinone reductase